MEQRIISFTVTEDVYQRLVYLRGETKKGWRGFWMLCARSYCKANIPYTNPGAGTIDDKARLKIYQEGIKELMQEYKRDRKGPR
jgi:hypothetical protein